MNKKEKVLAVASLAYIIGLFGFLLMLFLCILLEVQGVGNLVLLFLAFLFVGYIVVAIIRMCTYVYKCPKCNHLNKMNFFQVLFTKRGDNTRKLKCTKCNEVAHMERQVK
jgi:primosomal protein N'